MSYGCDPHAVDLKTTNYDDYLVSKKEQRSIKRAA
jgi:hypothetical protein